MKAEEGKNKDAIIKTELGKWLLDIGKYVATAVLIAGFFGNVDNAWIMLALGVVLTTLFVIFGIVLIKKS